MLSELCEQPLSPEVGPVGWAERGGSWNNGGSRISRKQRPLRNVEHRSNLTRNLVCIHTHRQTETDAHISFCTFNRSQLSLSAVTQDIILLLYYKKSLVSSISL